MGVVVLFFSLNREGVRFKENSRPDELSSGLHGPLRVFLRSPVFPLWFRVGSCGVVSNVYSAFCTLFQNLSFL